MRITNEWHTRDEIVEEANSRERARPQETLRNVALAGIALASGWTAWTYLSGSTENAAASLAEWPALAVDAGAHHSAVATAYADEVNNRLADFLRKSGFEVLSLEGFGLFGFGQ